MGEVFSFGGFALDLERALLLRNGEPQFLRPKALALLTHLAQHMGRVVSKAELMDAVWPGIFVTEDSLTQSIREVRKALGDDDQKLIRTISRRGYLLVKDAEAATEKSAQPVVAVLRFRNDTGDETQLPIVDGFTEDIINGLTRFGTVTVLARQSSFELAAIAGDVWTIAHTRLGVKYLVEGSIRRIAERLQISVGLIDAEARAQLWGERYDAEATAVFDVQRDIVGRIIGRLVMRLDDASLRQALRKPPADLQAHELMLRGVAAMNGNSPAEFAKSVALLEAAVAKDPSNGLAVAHLALAKVMLSGFGRSSREDLDKALAIVARAVAASPDQPVAHRVLSFVQMYRREYPAAEHHLRLAIELNPYDAESLEQMGYLLTLRGKPLEALTWMDRAVQINPIHPPWYEHDRSFALYMLGDYRAAAAAIELTPIPPAWMRTWLAACYAQMGDIETARHHAAQITQADRDFSAIDFARRNGAAFEHASDNQHFAEGVFLALGVPMEG